MSIWQDSKKAALRVEEAALLPAQPRFRNGAALQAAKRMEGLRLSGPVTAALGEALPSAPRPAPAPRASRAALRHVLRNRR